MEVFNAKHSFETSKSYSFNQKGIWALIRFYASFTCIKTMLNLKFVYLVIYCHITGEAPWLNFLLMEIHKVIWWSRWRNCKLMIPRVLNCAQLWRQDTLSSCFLFTKTKRILFSQLLDIYSMYGLFPFAQNDGPKSLFLTLI